MSQKKMRNYYQSKYVSLGAKILGAALYAFCGKPNVVGKYTLLKLEKEKNYITFKNDNLGDFVILLNTLKNLGIKEKGITFRIVTNKPGNIHLARSLGFEGLVEKQNILSMLRLALRRNNNIFVSSRSYPFSGSILGFLVAGTRIGYRNDGLDALLTHVLPSSKLVNQYRLLERNLSHIFNIGPCEMKNLNDGCAHQKIVRRTIRRSDFKELLSENDVLVCPLASAEGKCMSFYDFDFVTKTARSARVIANSTNIVKKLYAAEESKVINLGVADLLTLLNASQDIVVCSDSFLSHFAAYCGKTVYVFTKDSRQFNEWSPLTSIMVENK